MNNCGKAQKSLSYHSHETYTLPCAIKRFFGGCARKKTYSKRPY